jgi:hypothetical protein
MQNIVLHMMNFQHVHKIRGARNTNAKCLYDLLKKMDKTAIEVYPAIVTSYNAEDVSKSPIFVHLVVLCKDDKEGDQVLLDPSYDVFSHDNKRYYLNIKEFVDSIEVPEEKQNDLKSIATDFLALNEIAKQIVAETFENYNVELYQRQTEYVNLKCALRGGNAPSAPPLH